MKLHRLACVLVLLLLGRVALADDVLNALDAVFAAKDDKERDKLLKPLQGRALADHAAARKHAQGLQLRPPASLPVLKEAHEGALDYPYEVRTRRTVYKNYAMLDLPRGITREKPVPLVIGLHSEKGTAWLELAGLRACLAAGASGLAACILACPQALNRGLTTHDPTTNPPGIQEYFGWGPKQEGVDTVFNLIERLLADYNIDRDRIYLCGGGMGGEACFRLALLRPSLFAAIGVRDCLPPYYLTELKPADDKKIEDHRKAGTLGDQPVDFPWLQSLGNTPVTWVHANDDRQFPTAWARRASTAMQQAKLPLTWHEYEGFHGSGPTVLIAQALQEMLAFQRKPDPAAVSLRGVRDGESEGNSRSYWLEISQQTWPGKKGDWPNSLAAGGTATATLDKAANSVTVKADGVSEITLWLHDGLLDLGKPITVFIEGKESRQVSARRDLGVLAQSAWNLRASGEAFTARVTIRL